MATKDRSLQQALAEAGETPAKEWHRGDREKRCNQRLESYYRTRDSTRERVRLKRLNCKNKVFNYYGNKCQCCGEDFPPFLCIDHINGDGAAIRRANGKGRSGGGDFYIRIVKAGFPSDLQLLCHNCNFAKGTKLTCPCQQKTDLSKQH